MADSEDSKPMLKEYEKFKTLNAHISGTAGPI